MRGLVAMLVAVAGVITGVILSATLSGLVLGTVTYFLVWVAAPMAMLTDWTWTQHAVAAALVTLYGAAFTSARLARKE